MIELTCHVGLPIQTSFLLLHWPDLFSCSIMWEKRRMGKEKNKCTSPLLVIKHVTRKKGYVSMDV